MFIPKRILVYFGLLLIGVLVGGLLAMGGGRVLAQVIPDDAIEIIVADYVPTGPTGEDGPAGLSSAQAAPPAPPPPADPVVTDPLGVDPSEGGLASAPETPNRDVTAAIPIQGRLTDAAGVEIHGTRLITMTMYTELSGGSILCQDPDTVSASNGLFSTYMDFCTPSDLDGQQVYLGIQMQGEASEMTPRQPIYLTPYAYSLINGAHIGSLVSSADTEIYVSPQKINQSGASNLTFLPWSDGYTRVDANSTGTHYVYIPVDLPASLYGTAFKLKGLEYCYELLSATNYITGVDVRYVDSAGHGTVMISDPANRTSTTWTCVSLIDATPAQINGSVIVRFELQYANTTDTIQIGKIKLTLTQQ